MTDVQWKNRNLLLAGTLLFAFIVRLVGVTSPLLDAQDWRQVDTASISWNFLHQSFDIFKPQLFYDGPFPNIVQLELQITPATIAVLSMIFGYSDTLARLVPITFSVVTVYLLFLLVERWFDTTVAFWAAILYSVMPLSVFFTRTVQPESVTLFFLVGALYWTERLVNSKDSWTLRALVLFFLVMVPLSKLTAIFVFLPVLHIAWLRYRTSWGKYRWLITSMIVSVLLAATYYKWLEGVAEQRFVTGITEKHLIPEILALFKDLSAARFLWHSVGQQIFTPVGLVLAAVGLFQAWRNRLHPVLWSWLVATLVYAATIGAVIKYNYYMTLLTPVYGIIMAVGLVSIGRFTNRYNQRIGQVVMGVLVLLMAYFSIVVLRPWYDVEWWIFKAGQSVQEHTPTDAIVLVGDYNPSLLFYSRRAGYRVPQYQAEPADIESFREKGARYYLPTQRYGMFQRTKDYLAQFEAITDHGYTFYDLTKPSTQKR